MVEPEVVDLRSRQANIVDAMHVISLGRSFYTHSLYDFHGNLYPRMSPKFGCDELLRSTCYTFQVFFLFLLSFCLISKKWWSKLSLVLLA